MKNIKILPRMIADYSWIARSALGLAVYVMFGQQATCGAQDYVNSELPWHAAVIDSNGKLVSWYGADKNLGFDKVMHLAWDFMEHHVKIDPVTGQKIYLVNSTYDPESGLGSYWQSNPASTFGQFVDSLVTWYPYSGDEDAVRVVHAMLDYQLEHGTTPAKWEWGSVPFATGCGNDPEYGKCLQGLPRTTYGGIETDKVGELGIGYVLFYEMTGDKKYLDAGIRCADALSKHIRPGDETHTPWPFRIDAQTGYVVNGEEYGGMIVAPVRLFSELIRLKEGSYKEYESGRKLAWDWIRKYPMHNDRWESYFEDVPKQSHNANQAIPTMTAYYILTQPDPGLVDPQWIGDVGHIIDWVRRHYGRGPYFGAWAIDEQGSPPEYVGCCSRAGLASDTSRWAAINALYYEKTQDGQAHIDAFRSLSYATYFAADDGKIACCGLDYDHSQTNSKIYWFDDGYGDYVRNFMWTLGAIPDMAPVHENHLLRSSSVVQSIEYGNHNVKYRTFDAEGIEVLRLNYKPTAVDVGGHPINLEHELKDQGYEITPLSEGDYTVRVRHTTSGDIKIVNY